MSSPPLQIILARQAAGATQLPRWRPGPIADSDIDLAVKTSYDNTYGLEQTSAQLPDALRGSRVSSGALSVTGSLKAVATGLSTVSNVIVSIDNGLVPHNWTCSATPSETVPGTFDVAVFQPTSPSNNAPILNTVPTIIRWHAWGT